MILDNNLYLMKIGGRPNDSTAWSSLWAAAANYSSSIDMTTTSNRAIAEMGYMVFRVGGAFAQAANDSTWQIVTSASATMTTDTVIWSSGTLANTVAAAWVANSIIWVIKLPVKIALRYLAVLWTPATSAFTSGTMDIFITTDAPYSQVGAV